MAVDRVAFFIGAPDDTHLGPDHTADNTRGFIFDATGGAEGVSHPTAMKVLPLFTPGGGVRVLPGGALLNNRYPGGDGQTYRVRNASQTELTVPKTPSTGGRTDLIISRILDPQYEGDPPEDPNDFDYHRLRVLQDVPSGTTTAEELNLGYPAIALARIQQPASWNLVDNEHITRLTQLARPKTDSTLRIRPITAGEAEELVARRENGEWFPNTGGEQDIFIPRWATHIQIEYTLAGVRYDNATNPFGWHWAEFGPGVGGDAGPNQDRKYRTQGVRFDGVGGSTGRFPWIGGGTEKLGDDVRGKLVKFIMKARYDNADAGPGVKIDAGSLYKIKVTYLQEADHTASTT